MINLEDWRKEALDFETKYATLIKNICKLSELKNERYKKSELLDDNNSYTSHNPFENKVKEKTQQQLRDAIDDLDKIIKNLENNITEENIDHLHGEIANFRDEICSFRNSHLNCIINEQNKLHESAIEAWPNKEVKVSDSIINVIPSKTDRKKDLDYLEYLKTIESLIKNVAEYRDKYAVGEIYYALVYLYDRLYEPIDETNKSQVIDEAKRHFNDALEYVNKYCENEQKVIYTCMLAEDLEVDMDVAVELKNMLIESEVLSRDGGISWSTKSAINNLLRDKQEFQQGE